MVDKRLVCSAKEALEAIARRSGVTVEDVRREITVSLARTRTDPDPQIQALWDSMPNGGAGITPEEFIACLVEQGRSIIH